ncbi:MAG: Kelch repeat-containing protein [Ginsengibacter sp.]
MTDAGGLSSKDMVQVTVQLEQQGCDALNRATIAIQWIPLATIPNPRDLMTTATAGNKLLLVGGRTPDDTPISDVDIYDIGTQTWSTARLSIGRLGMTAVTVGNKIFFVGGDSPGISATARVDIYDASTNTWSFSDLPSPASIVWSYAVVGNKVFFVTDRVPEGGKVDIYDTSTGLWSAIDLPEHQAASTATTVGDKVYFAGGSINYPSNNLSNVVDIYDNATGTWSQTSHLNQPTEVMGSIYVNGKIYWAGGVIGYDAALDTFFKTCKVEIRDVSTGSSSFTSLSAENDFESSSSIPIYYNNKIMFQGGNYFDIYDPRSNTWSIGQFPPNVFLASVILINNALHVIAGYNDQDQLPDRIWKLQY